MTWLQELYPWLMIWSYKQLWLLVWVSIHYNGILGNNTKWYIRFDIGIVSVDCKLNIYQKPKISYGELFDRSKHCQLWSPGVPTTITYRMQDVHVQVWSVTLTQMVPCGGWPNAYLKHNDLKPHCNKMKTRSDLWHLSPNECGKGMAPPQ